MRYKTMASVALLAVSSAALAQMTSPRGHTMNNSAMNSTMPTNSTMPMNTQDEGMMNDMSMPNSTMTPNSTMPPR